MTQLTKEDYLSYESPELKKIRKSIWSYSKVISFMNLTIQTAMVTSPISIMIGLIFLGESNQYALYYAIASFLWLVFYVYYISDLPSKNYFFKSLFHKWFLKSFLANKLKLRFHSLFYSNNKVKSLFIKRANNSYIDKEEYLVGLYDFLKNIENKNLSQEDIFYFLDQDDFFCAAHDKIISKYENQQKVKIMENISKENDIISIPDISNSKIQHTAENLEQEFNFNKV